MKANTYEYPDFDKFNTFPKLLKYRSEIMPNEIACHANGGMSLGVYRDTLDDEVGYLVKSAKVRFAYAEDQEQVDKLMNVQKRLKTKIKVIYDNPRGLEKLKNPNVINMKDLASVGKKQLDKNNKLYGDLINKVSGETVSVLCTT